MMQKYGKMLINLNNPVILTFDNGLSPALIRCYHAVSIKVNIVPSAGQIIDAYSNNCVFYLSKSTIMWAVFIIYTL
jgi:hypothetical protein